jgi:hypothetical protein
MEFNGMDQPLREPAQQPEEISPNWREGVPTEFNRIIFGEGFLRMAIASQTSTTTYP